MPNIPIEYGYPIIATKDKDWIKHQAKTFKAEQGAIWLLPDDAVLIFPPVTIDQPAAPQSSKLGGGSDATSTKF